MHYNIPEIPESDFQQMQEFVKRAHRKVRRTGHTEVDVAIASTDMSEVFSGEEFKRRLRLNYVGWAVRPDNKIWIKSRPENVRDMERTAVHEIAHLYSNGDSHGAEWRKTFGIAWAMWLRHKHQESWTNIRWDISSCVRKHRKYRFYTPQGRWNNPEKYNQKIRAEIVQIHRTAQALCE
jgi:hypothetical protein